MRIHHDPALHRLARLGDGLQAPRGGLQPALSPPVPRRGAEGASGACPLDDVEAFDGLQRQVLGVLVAVHHALDDEAREEMPDAMRRQRVALAVERSKRRVEGIRGDADVIGIEKASRRRNERMNATQDESSRGGNPPAPRGEPPGPAGRLCLARRRLGPGPAKDHSRPEQINGRRERFTYLCKEGCELFGAVQPAPPPATLMQMLKERVPGQMRKT
jgi:hypothetical protein